MTETLDGLGPNPALVAAARALEPPAAQLRHAELSELIRRANREYFLEDAPELSDFFIQGHLRKYPLHLSLDTDQSIMFLVH